MKFENLYIECENLEQRDEVADFVKISGYSYVDSAREDSTVAIYGDGRFQYLSGSCKFSPSIGYSQFMQKYGKSEMKKSIEKAMAELKLNRHELSSALGMSRPYITKMLTCPQSENTQAKVIKMIDDLIESVNVVRQLRDAVSSSPIIIDARDKTIKELNQALEYKDQLLARNEDEFQKKSKELHECKCDILELSKTVVSDQAENSELRLMISVKQKSIEDEASELLDCKTENLNLSNQVEYLKRENKDIQIHHAIVCVILIILVAWGFYV